MRQFSVRLSDDLGLAVKRLAEARGRSVNQTFEDLVVAATDPDGAGSADTALRERLARADLVWDAAALGPIDRPSPDLLAEARAAAGRGRSLSDIVAEQR